MRFSVLSSGSKANCTYFEASGKRFLIDCGLSARQTELRLSRIGVSPEDLDAIFITHEHRDHIYGVSVMSRRYSLPVFLSEGTSEFVESVYGKECFSVGTSFDIGAVSISPFQIVHDATDPVAFVFQAEGLKFGQATDLGRTTPLVRDFLRDCHALVIESNHDEEMLRECEYPWVLKQRISSSHGHLSNEACAELLDEVVHSELEVVVLAHLSENSNTPELARESATRGLWKLTNSSHAEFVPELVCGNPRQETPLFNIGERENKANRKLAVGE